MASLSPRRGKLRRQRTTWRGIAGKVFASAMGPRVARVRRRRHARRLAEGVLGTVALVAQPVRGFRDRTENRSAAFRVAAGHFRQDRHSGIVMASRSRKDAPRRAALAIVGSYRRCGTD